MAPTSRDQDVLTVVANRLPIERTEEGWAVAPGGLVNALRPVLQRRGGIWVGWTGEAGSAPRPFTIGNLKLVPVELSASEIEDYYQGFANGTLWPLCHDNIHRPQFHRHWWHPYRQVNRRFARLVAEVAPPGGAVWVHDYHLTLVPRLLRQQRPDLRIGYFLHIPFPPHQLIAQLPWRSEVLHGILGADSVGFQTVFDQRNFRDAARRFLNAHTAGPRIRLGDHTTIAQALPISIDARAFATAAASPEVEQLVEDIARQWGHRRILFGADRLDYSKGIETRLRVLETVLDRHPDLADQIVFVQITVPSREEVAGYAEMRQRIEQLAGRINGKHSHRGHQPVYYRYTTLDRRELVVFYRAAEVMLVTPLRDGMNLVAKEYVACRINNDGVLVLSEFAGAAHELKGAVMVNPYDLDGTADALEMALAMDREQQRQRMRPMRRHLFTHDVHAWADKALASIDAASPARKS